MLGVKNILDIKVAIIPSWFNEIVVSDKIPYRDLISYPRLHERAQNGQFSVEELYGYILTNNRFTKFFGDVYDDLYMISRTDENLAFFVSHQASIEAHQRMLDDEEFAKSIYKSDEEKETSIITKRASILEREHYAPKLVQGEVLYLVGSTEKVFDTKRDYYNALLETLRSAKTFEDLKSTKLFKHYLKHAVDE